MKKINFNKNWEFTLDADLDAYNVFGFLKYGEAIGASAQYYDHSNWEHVELPHDWAIALPKNVWGDSIHGSRNNTSWHQCATERHMEKEQAFNIGWYRKQFFLGKEYENKRIFIEFEGVFRDAIVWVNGVYIDRHTSGYTGFYYEITDHLVIGGENSIAVRVDSDQHEGWWYEGSGIYRNVFLVVGESVYFKFNQTVVKTTLEGSVSASACLVNDTEEEVSDWIEWSIWDPNGMEVANKREQFCISPYSEAKLETTLAVENPQLWSVDTPNLYKLKIEAIDTVEETFGIRTATFDCDKGFFLNGKPLKLHGACVHQDFGGVGVALSDNLQRYKIQKLKEMGVNAYRASHHAPAPALLRACDELGMLVIDETRMFGTSPEALRQLQELIERDRNHPSIILWCAGNEEFSIQDVEWSYRLMKKVTRLIKKWDDTRLVTYSGCNGSNDIGANGAAEVRGINYIRNGDGGSWVDKYHEDHPDQPIVGTEESSCLFSRGGDKNDFGSGILDCTGDVTTPWASTPKGWVKYAELRPHLAGCFMWTGFDYRGEPVPFDHCNVSSSFGTIDLCGMPKPPFYYYKSWWTDEPVLKLAPHWNYKLGEEAWVKVFTNCTEVELFLNETSIGIYPVEKFDTVTVKLPFEPGVLRAVGKRNGEVYVDELRTASAVNQIMQETVLRGENKDDISIVELKAVDKAGNFCPLADDVIEVELHDGRIIGVGNGDPASFDYEQKADEEECRVIRVFETEDRLYYVPPKVPNTIVNDKYAVVYEEKTEGYHDDCRMIADFVAYPPEVVKKTFTTRITGVKGYEYLEFERFGADAVVYLNGKEIGTNVKNFRHSSARFTRPYRFYCDFTEDVNEIRIEATIKDGAVPFSGCVKAGKKVRTPWKVRLHYGLARVFVKSDALETLQVRVK